MTISSWFWTTSGVGHGDLIDRAEWAAVWANMLGRGVLGGPGNQFLASGAASPLSVAEGWAIVGGFIAYNDAVLSLAVPTPASGTTGHRVVLRATADTQLVTLELKSAADGIATPPALQQDATFPNAGTVYEENLATLVITTLGVITLTDARRFMVIQRALRIPNGILKLEHGDLGAGNSGTPNVIGGYSGNLYKAGVQGAAILGGGELGNENYVTDHYCVVGGGMLNQAGNDNVSLSDADFATVGGGWSNTASGKYSTVGGGAANSASAGDATVGGGQNNQASGDNATVGGGQSNVASGDDSTVPGGFGNEASGDYGAANGGYAKADKYGQAAWASGRFGATGDAQRSTLVARLSQASHVDDTWYNLWLNGSSERITIAANSAWLFTAMVIGETQNAAQTWAYKVEGVVKRDNANNTSVVVSAVTAITESDAAYDCQAQANDTDEALEIQIKKAAGGTDYAIRWVARLDLVEVVYA